MARGLAQAQQRLERREHAAARGEAFGDLARCVAARTAS